MAKTERNPRSDAAYEVVPGVTAEQAAEQGLAVVEYAVSGSSFAPVYGRYLNTETGASLEQRVYQPGDMVTVPAGGETVATAPAVTTKGGLINPNDPVVHGTANENVHADGTEPVTKSAAQAAEVAAAETADAKKK